MTAAAIQILLSIMLVYILRWKTYKDQKDILVCYIPDIKFITLTMKNAKHLIISILTKYAPIVWLR